jgi:hypothetical protein
VEKCILLAAVCDTLCRLPLSESTEEIEGKGYLFQKEARHCLVWKVELVEPLIATVPNVFEGESEGAIDLGVVNHLVHQRRPACHLMASNELSR